MKLPFYIHTTDDMNKRWRIVGILLVVVCVAFTLGLWYTLEESNTQIAANRLSNDKDVVLDTMEKRLEVYSDVLYGGRALFLIDPELSRNDWDTFMDSQNLFERYPALNMVAYVQATDRRGVEEILSDVNTQTRSGESNAVLFPDRETEKYAIVKYTTQIEGFRMVGLNAYADDAAAVMLDTAAVKAVPVASKPIMSRHQDRTGTMDVLIALAVYERTYRNGMSDDEKQARLKGYIMASIHPETLFQQAVGSLNNPDSVAILVETQDSTTVYEYGSDLNGSRIAQTSTINVAGQAWNITLSAPAIYDLTPRQIYAPLFFLVAGLVFMVIVVNLFFYWTGVRFTRHKPTPKRSK